MIAEKGKLSAKGARKHGVQGRFLAALEMTVGGEWIAHVSYKGYVGKTPFPQRHPDRSGGIFLAYWYSVLCETAEKGKPFAKEARSNRVQGRFLAALEMTVGGMGLFHVAYNGYVWKALFPHRHPERSRGIFLAHRYSVLCETAGKGKPFAKGARKSRVQGRFLAALEMTVGGNGFISRSVQRICLENAIPVALFLYRHPERSRGIFLAHWYSAVCVIAEKGKPFAKGARKSRVQGRFLAALEMTVGENGFISRSVQRICLENAASATSSRAKLRGLSGTPV